MTDTTLITCPQCGTEIPLTDALTGKIKNQMRGEMQAQLKAQEEAMKKREEALREAQKDIDQQVQKKLENEKKEMWQRAQKAAQEAQKKDLEDLKAQNEERQKKLDEAQRHELELRKKTRELEEKDKNRQLEMERKIDEERKKMENLLREQMNEENRKKLSEKDMQLEQMKRTIDDLKRKSEQGSMQLQGDAQEEALKKMLEQHFPIDEIQDIATGVRGADLLQKVRSSQGQMCGTVLWESKITKTWNEGWIAKLKDDQVESKADVAILITATLPKDIENFTQKNGVWIVSFPFSLAIISAIRFHLIELKKTQKSLEGQDEKMKFLYQYLSGPQFKNRIENIVSAFTEMKNNLDAEKRAMTKLWARREKEIERVINNTSGMYGDLQGIVGATLQNIPQLEFPLEEESELF